MIDDAPEGDALGASEGAELPEEPAAPARWFKVEYVAPSRAKLPIFVAGQHWHERSTHVVPESCAEKLGARTHFTVLGETEAPANPTDCGCH